MDRMADRELLAAIGEIVVDAAALEYFIAVLVSVIEGRDEERARKLASSPGAARHALKGLVSTRPDRLDLRRLYQDAVAVLDDRHVIVHSVAMATDLDRGDEPGLGIWNPRRDSETRITAPQVLDHAHDIRIVGRRARALIVAETSDGEPGPG
jgi:hypothetical protein